MQAHLWPAPLTRLETVCICWLHIVPNIRLPLAQDAASRLSGHAVGRLELHDGLNYWQNGAPLPVAGASAQTER